MEQKWLIWSLEHQKWWKESRNGYTEYADLAGHFDFDEALQILKDANIGGLNEAMAPVPEHLL